MYKNTTYARFRNLSKDAYVIHYRILTTGRLWLDMWLTLSMILLQFWSILFSYKLCVTEKRTYVNKLKFTIFWRFCCQYFLISYLCHWHISTSLLDSISKTSQNLHFQLEMLVLKKDPSMFDYPDFISILSNCLSIHNIWIESG